MVLSIIRNYYKRLVLKFPLLIQDLTHHLLFLILKIIILLIVRCTAYQLHVTLIHNFDFFLDSSTKLKICIYNLI